MAVEAQPVEYCLFFVNHWTTCMQKTEWASWVQAIGAILAILAAVCLVAWERSDAYWQRRAAAQAVGSGMLVEVNQVLGLLAACANEFETALFDNSLAQSIQKHRELIAVLTLPQDSEVLVLAGALPKTAVHVVRGRNLIRQAKNAMDLAVQGGFVLDRSSRTEGMLKLLRFAHEEFSHVRAQLDGFCP